MIVFSLFFLLSFFIANMSSFKVTLFSKHASKVTFFVLVSLLLIMGLRSYNVTGDTITYVSDFIEYDLRRTTLQSIFINSNEPLFALFTYITRLFTSSYVVYLTLSAMPLITGLCLILYNSSEDSFLSIVVFIAIGILTFCMAGLRQAMALGFCMIAYFFAERKKIIFYLLFCFIAFLFHNSSIVFLLVYLFKKIKVTYFQWIIVLFSLFVGVTKWNGIIAFIALFGSRFSSYLLNNSSLNLTMFVVQFMLFIVCWIFRKDYLKNNENGNMLFNMAFLGIGFQAMTPVVGEFFRISFYFSFSLCLLVPNVLKTIKNDDYKYLLYWGISLTAILFCFISQNFFSYYQFFWEV